MVGRNKVGAIVLFVIVAAAAAAPWLAPNPPDRRFNDLLYAPPTRVHLFGDMVATHIYPWRLVSRLERRFEEDRSRAISLRWFRDGRFVTGDADGGAPLLILGADGYGRDLFARLLYGGRATLAVAAIATLGATLLGALIGGVSGQTAGWIDAVLSRVSEFVLVLPAIYVALALRARDIYLVAGCAAMGGLFLAIGSVVADLLLVAADPRVRDGDAV